MAVDIRATVTCSLGTLVSFSLSEDYLQGNGLIRVRGNAVISGTITPALGTAVTFSYTKGGVTRNVPRKLRVLSSFADPYRRTTSIELGCKLTYLADLRAPINWAAFDDTTNNSYNEEDANTIPLPIRASSVMTKCLTELGITASGNPLTNRFSVGEFDFSSGYVDVLSDLLVSECYCGYLDYNETLQIIDLRQGSGTGPLYTENDIIDHGPINSGQLPGEAVTVSYSSLRLRPPDPTEDNKEERNWERDESISGPNVYYVGNNSYTGMETVASTVSYTTINDTDVPIRRVTTETASTAKIAGSIGTAYVNNDIGFNPEVSILRREVETTEYDTDGNRTRTEVNVYEHALAFYGGVSLDYVFPSATQGGSPSFVVLPTGMLHREQTVTRYKRVGTAEQQITETKIAWILSTPGQQAVAENRAELETAAAVQSFIAAASLTGLVHERTTISINTRNTIQGKPRATLAISLRKRTAKPPGTQVNPGNVRQVSSAGLILALGSGTAQRRVEFSMPYAPDDYFSGPSGGPYTLVRGDHATKATNFGRVQNRLFLGNRSGMNLQLAPERLPEAPFAPMYVQANGLTAQYRANGNQWAGDSNGLVCSTDALFWAAVGGTGTFWFPVAPGVTSLPATPPAVDGQLNPAIAILPYNETVEVSAVVRTALRVQRFSYSLQPHTTDIGRVVIRTKVKAARVNLVFMPAPPAITLSAPTPQIGQAVEVVQSYIFLLHMTPNVPSISTT